MSCRPCQPLEAPKEGLRATVPESKVESVNVSVERWPLVVCGTVVVAVVLTLLSYAIGSQAMSMKSDAGTNGTTDAGHDSTPISGLQVGHFLLMLANQGLAVMKTVLAQDGLFWPRRDSLKTHAWLYTISSNMTTFAFNTALCWVHCAASGEYIAPYILMVWALQLTNQGPLSDRPMLGICKNTSTAVIVPDAEATLEAAPALPDRQEAKEMDEEAAAGAFPAKAAVKSARFCPSEFSGLLKTGPVVLAYKEEDATEPQDRVVTNGEYGTIAAVMVAHLITGGIMYAICNRDNMPNMEAMNHWAAWGALLISAMPTARRWLEVSEQRTCRTLIAGTSQLAFSFVSMMLCCMAPGAFIGVFLGSANNAAKSALRTAVKRPDEWFTYHADRAIAKAAEESQAGVASKPSLARSLAKCFEKCFASKSPATGRRESLLVNGDEEYSII